MIESQSKCDTERVAQYLTDRLAEDSRQEFEQHLSTCEFCRNELHNQAAEPEVWEDAAQLLSVTVAAGDDLNETETEGQQRSVMSVLDSLAPTDDPEMLGRIGEYEISGVVGVGGMGAVLKGFDRSLRRVVAVKVMAPHLANNGSARTRFQREARAAAAVTHDNVIDTYGVSEANGLPYLVMPFARGPSLQKRIDQSGPLTAIEVIRIGRQIASGLAAAHEQGLVHRDIKPANILLNEGIERLWITDFGVARAMDDASMTQTGLIAGTPQYMSPEQARGESVDHRSDLFSLGSVLYTACTGRVPFRSEAAYGILRQITDTDPCPIQEINPDIPEWLCRTIDRLMAKHAADRFQTAHEVAELLDGCLAHMQQPTVSELPSCLRTPQTFPETATTVVRKNESPVVRSPGRFRGKIAMLSCLFLSVCGFAAFQMTTPSDISGNWKGEHWSAIQLATVDEASDWYNGTLKTADGRQGAVQLEWSRLQRRYNGRWKIGSDQSGALTLRVGQDGRVRGAVSVDPDSAVAEDAPRLRELVWDKTKQMRELGSIQLQQVVGKKQEISKDATAKALSAVRDSMLRPQSIESPVDAKVVRIEVAESATVEKGQLIAVLHVEHQGKSSRIAANRAANRDYFAGLLARKKATVVELKDKLENDVRELETMFSELKHLEVIKEQSVAIARAKIENAKSSIDAAVAERQETLAKLNEARKEFERISDLKNAISESEKVAVETKLRSLEAQLQAAEAGIKTAKNDVVVVEGEERVKASQAETDADKLRAKVESKRALISSLEQAIDAAKQKVVEAEQASQKSSEQQETRVVRQVEIKAPFHGVISNLSAREGQSIKTGEPICMIRRAFREKKQSAAATQSTQPQTQETTVEAATEDARSPGQSIATYKLPENKIVLSFLSTMSTSLADLSADAGKEMKRQQELSKQLTTIANIAELEGKEIDSSMKSQLAKAMQDSQERLQVVQAKLDELVARRETTRQLLNLQLKDVENRVKLSKELFSNTQQRYTVGDVSKNEVLAAEREFTTSQSELNQIQALMAYFKQLQKRSGEEQPDEEQPAAEPESDKAESDH